MSVQDRFPHSTAELRRVKAVQFGILSPDEIVRAFSRTSPLTSSLALFSPITICLFATTTTPAKNKKHTHT